MRCLRCGEKVFEWFDSNKEEKKWRCLCGAIYWPQDWVVQQGKLVKKQNNARMAELEDASGLEPDVLGRGGSTPSSRTVVDFILDI